MFFEKILVNQSIEFRKIKKFPPYQTHPMHIFLLLFLSPQTPNIYIPLVEASQTSTLFISIIYKFLFLFFLILLLQNMYFYIKLVYLFGLFLLRALAQDVPYDVNYKIIFGNQNVVSFNQGRRLQIALDKYSGNLVIYFYLLLNFCYYMLVSYVLIYLS